MADPRTRQHRDRLSVPVRRVSVALVRGGPAARVEGERVTIGSASDCDVSLTERTVSRYHAEIAASSEGISVRDLGSTNGVVCGGTRIVLGVVPPGTILELGAAAIRVDDAELGSEPLAPAQELGALVAHAPIMRRLLDRIPKVAASDASVLITGEPGSGKELVARTIHAHGPRRAGALVVVDAGTLSGALVASDLFGHEKGAFTDADERRAGAFERAQGGTLLLDDVSQLPLDVQPMLLGALERRSARRVGGQLEVPYDVRVIACSSCDLRREVNAGRFRLDLYYRLAVVRLEVPALRERLDDLPALAARFVEERGEGPSHPLLSPERMTELAARDWPGNVRELRNVIDAAIMLDDLDLLGEDASAQHAGAPEAESTDALIESGLALPYKEARARFAAALERAYLDDLLRRAKGNISVAARMAGLDRSQLRQLLARHRSRGDA
ncbi:MAG: sigma 54-interacting transcriptional regulator [Myxococcota bacterium]|nr:sigma 54-interacting transcriptional regulator [Myxococcota bacterium]